MKNEGVARLRVKGVGHLCLLPATEVLLQEAGEGTRGGPPRKPPGCAAHRLLKRE